MRLVEVKQSLTDGVGSAWLHVPEAWDCFTYRGFLYVLVEVHEPVTDDVMGVRSEFRCVEELPK